MERFACDPRVLARYARHYSSGAPLAEEDMSKLAASRSLLMGVESKQHVMYAAFDQVRSALEIFFFKFYNFRSFSLFNSFKFELIVMLLLFFVSRVRFNFILHKKLSVRPTECINFCGSFLEF